MPRNLFILLSFIFKDSALSILILVYVAEELHNTNTVPSKLHNVYIPLFLLFFFLNWFVWGRKCGTSKEYTFPCSNEWLSDRVMTLKMRMKVGCGLLFTSFSFLNSGNFFLSSVFLPSLHNRNIIFCLPCVSHLTMISWF